MVAPGHLGNGLRCQKVGVGFFGRGPENWHFSYLTAPAGQVPREWAQVYHCGGGAAALGLRGVGADGPTIIHTGTGNGGPGWAKGGDGAAYIMPDWAGRMGSIL